MISRRLLRIKAMQLLYAFRQSKDPSLSKYEKELFFSIDKAYQLYHNLLQLITEITRYAEDRMDVSKAKYFPTDEERTPNTKFIHNKVIEQIKENKQLNRYIEETKIGWVNHSDLIKNLYESIKKSPAFEAYMGTKESSYQEDKRFVISIFETDIASSELLYEILEDQSIYWNDDVDFMISMIIKTLEKFKETDPSGGNLLPLFKDEDDKDFVRTLFRKAIINHKENSQLIEKYTKNWDFDRIAFMDIILIELALTEAVEMPSIPTKVSFNEYIEISKYYSTNKSSIFINGVLDKIIQHLKNENKIHKTGRGLIGEK